MVQNLKVDIIYHLTASDFEMEFNLGGCCRMRLLNDKTTDKKGFVKSLARAVSRSRIIIACGPLFSADGLIATVAAAIGNGVTLCDNKTYGINSDEPIHIIKGSTPLVTSNGYFGGCIIESGPQTIILLTENKAFRKSIMQNLIHPYIEEISYIPSRTTPLPTGTPEPEPVFETAVTENENYLAQPEADEAEPDDLSPEQKPFDEHNIDFIMDSEPDNADAPSAEEAEFAPVDDSYNIMYAEVEKPEDINSRYSEPYSSSESDNMFIASSEPDEKPIDSRKKDGNLRAMNIAIVILVLLLLLAILAIAYLIVLKPMTMGMSTVEYLKEIFGAASKNTLI